MSVCSNPSIETVMRSTVFRHESLPVNPIAVRCVGGVVHVRPRWTATGLLLRGQD